MENMKFIASALSAILLALALPNELTSQGVALVVFFCLGPYFAALIKSRSYGGSGPAREPSSEPYPTEFPVIGSIF